jgi:hypothetical protein
MKQTVSQLSHGTQQLSVIAAFVLWATLLTLAPNDSPGCCSSNDTFSA